MTTRPPGRPPKSGESFNVRIEIRSTQEERERFDQAARLAALERSDWIRRVLTLEANRIIQEHDDALKLKRAEKSVKRKVESRVPPGAVSDPS